VSYSSNCRLSCFTDEVAAKSDNMTESSTDNAATDSCTDAVGTSQVDESSYDCNQLSVTTDATATSLEELGVVDSTAVSGIRQRPAAASATSLLPEHTHTLSANMTMSGHTNMSGKPCVSENAPMSANPATSTGQTVSVQEYCQAFEQWAWQYYWWMQHVHWMTWAAQMSAPVYPAMSCIPSTNTQSIPNSVAPATSPVGLPQQPVQQQQIPQRRGNTCQFVQSFKTYL